MHSGHLTPSNVPDRAADQPTGSDEETADQRRNRQLIELLNELRLAVPGVQMLFGFLLAVPFSARFASVSDLERDLYLVSFLAAAAASLCLIAPTSIHRIEWRHGQKQQLINLSNTLAILGTLFLAIAISAALGFVIDFLLGGAWAALVGAASVLLFASLWYAVPLIRLWRTG
jgi:hypothetical protein